MVTACASQNRDAESGGACPSAESRDGTEPTGAGDQVADLVEQRSIDLGELVLLLVEGREPGDADATLLGILDEFGKMKNGRELFDGTRAGGKLLE